MLPNLVKEEQKLGQAVVSTLAFFSLYDLPLSAKRVHELLWQSKATPEEVNATLTLLVRSGQIVQIGNLYSLKQWDQSVYQANQLELTKKWQKIDKYFNWLAIIPFVRQISIINSLALGTADSDSDIDFFVITKPNRLYFVRSIFIVLFRLLGVYKTRQIIKDRFCFGFYVSAKHLELEQLMIKPTDPYFVFWLANMRPVLGGKYYWQLMQQNQWITEYFPNYKPMERLASVKSVGLGLGMIKLVLEAILWLPSLMAEPWIRHIHINHTFKLAENKTVTSTTIANPRMLKLHALDVRKSIADKYKALLQSL